nr:hypothetical protein [Tanacetum cinerariifolium]
MKETPYELLMDNEKKQLGKNEESKMTIYIPQPQKEYKRVFMCKTIKERAKMTTIEEAKDLATLPLDELIGNIKVYEMVLHNDGVSSKTTKEKVKSLALKNKVTREKTSDDSDSQDGSDEEEVEAFNLLARNFQKFFHTGNLFGRGNQFGNNTNRFGRGRGSLGDKSICDLNKTPDLSQRPSQNCPKCGNPVDGHYCQGCALLRKKFKDDLFTYCIENGILQDSSELSNDNTNVVNSLQDPFVVKQDPGAHYGYNCSPKVPIIPNSEPYDNQTIDKLPQTMLSFDPTCYFEDGNSFTYDSRSNLVDDSPNVFNSPSQPPLYPCEFCGNDAHYGHYCTPQVLFIYPKPIYKRRKKRKQIEEEQAAKARYWNIPICYDDDKDYTIVITPKEPDNSLSMRDEHLDTIPAMESDEFIKSSVENLVLNPSESEGEYECEVSACEDFTTFSNIHFDSDYDFSSVDEQSFYDEDILKKIYSNPLFDEEIISMKIDPHHFNAESDLIESLLNHSERDILILEEFLGNDSLSLPENESFHFDIPSSSHPPAKPLDGNSGILNVKVIIPLPRLMLTQPTLVPNQEKSPGLLSHQGHEAS